MSREIRLLDRNPELVPSERRLVLLRHAQLEIIDGDGRRRRMHVETARSVDRSKAGVRVQLAGRDRRCQYRVRESLQRREIDGVEREVGRDLRVPEVERSRPSWIFR